MTAANIRTCTVDEIVEAEGFADLLDEYGEECGNRMIGSPKAQIDAYRAMHNMGFFHLIGAFHGAQVIGFLALIIVEMPHYDGARVLMPATSESLFVASAHRKSGAGLKLISYAEELSKAREMSGLFLSAPNGSRLEKLLPEIGYKHTNTVFFKAFK